MPGYNRGAIFLHRSIDDCPALAGVKNQTTKMVFIELLKMARWKDADPDDILPGMKRPLKRSELTTSVRSLGNRIYRDRSSIHRSFNALKRAKMITTYHVNPKRLPEPGSEPGSEPGYSLISICNYDKYQCDIVSPEPGPEPGPEPFKNKVKEGKIKKDCYYDPRRSPSQYDYITKDEKLSVYMAYDNITNADVDGGVRNTQVRMLLHEVGLEKTKLLLELLTGELKLKNLKRLSLRETKELHQVGLYLLDKKTHLPDKR